ncbi:MAG: HU family DNA-binding protein [Oscillospiraceae bacterium]|jgi:DNA-binding protein HU-beta|nr:HU family DNA-binding protein [Oscillospiraceae bacterium]
MTRQDVIDALAAKTGLTKKDSTAFLSTFFEIIGEKLAAGDKISFTGFGTFEVRERAARDGVNPRTGEQISIPASRYAAFKAGKVLKETVN